MSNTVQRLLLADDDEVLAKLLGRYLQGANFDTDLAYTGKQALSCLAKRNYDCIVLDVMMPQMDGFELLQLLRRQYPNLPVLMLSARGEDIDRIVGLESGADDYLAKPCNPRELLARIRALLRRHRRPDGNTLCIGDLRLIPSHHLALCEGKRLQLTAAECRILELLMRHAGQAVSKETLSLQALGRSLQPFDRSPDIHISRLRKKLGPLPSGEPRILTLRGRGYLYPQDVDTPSLS